MDNNLNTQILASYSEMIKMHNEIDDMLSSFIEKANELVELSEDDYQIEKTLTLNKISLKAFILDSSCCVELNNNNITSYTIQELKNYLTQYEQANNEDYTKYHSAVSLYEYIEEIENLVDKKVNLEMTDLSFITSDINTIKDCEKEKYEELYLTIKGKIDGSFRDNKLDKNTYSICIQILNDIFNFYIGGYPNIPDEYLYIDDDV